jgi:hypothetical protein
MTVDFFEQVLFVLGALSAGLSALVSYLNRKEIRPPKKARRRELLSEEEKPKTLGESVDALRLDMESMKKQQTDTFAALVEHIAYHNGSSKNG